MAREHAKLPQPMLAPNDCPDLGNIPYPILASSKLDGVRFLIFDGKMLSRKMEPLHPATVKRFQPVIDWAAESNICVDGEIWSPNLKFNQIQSALAHPSPNDGLKLYVFDILPIDEWYSQKSWKEKDAGEYLTPFSQRHEQYVQWCKGKDSPRQFLVPVEQHRCLDKGQVMAQMRVAREQNGEGLMLKAPDSFYVHSRTTAKQNIFWKLKFWNEVNAKIVGFKQGKTLTEEARENNTERNALGSLKRGHRKGDREEVDKVGSVEVEVTSGQIFPAGTRCFVGFTEEAYSLRTEITWENKERFLGKHVDIVFQEHGSKNKPRMGRIVRLRQDLD
jgi:DNA ligase-1